jgi:hypothetical protein
VPFGRKTSWLLIAACFLASAGIARSEEAGLQDALKLSAEKQWGKATELYRSLNKKSDSLSPAFYFDYGTTALQAGLTGEANAMLWRAAFAAPFDNDIRGNLEITQEKLAPDVRAVRPATWFSWWPEGARTLPWQIPVLCGLLLLGPVLLSVGRKRRALSPAMLSLAGLASVALFVGGFSAWQTSTPAAGVVQSTSVNSGPGASYPQITSIQAGSLVNLEESRDGWSKIRYVDSRLQESVGWVESSTVLKLN